MPKDFVSVQGKILDTLEYQRKLLLLKNYVKFRISDLLSEDGFHLLRGRDSDAKGLELIFYNADLDLQCRLVMKKKSKWVGV